MVNLSKSNLDSDVINLIVHIHDNLVNIISELDSDVLKVGDFLFNPMDEDEILGDELIIWGKLYKVILISKLVKNTELLEVDDKLDDILFSLEFILGDLYSNIYDDKILNKVAAYIAYFVERENLEDFHSSQLPLTDDIVCKVNKLAHISAFNITWDLMSPSFIDRFGLVLVAIFCPYIKDWANPYDDSDSLASSREKVLSELHSLLNK